MSESIRYFDTTYIGNRYVRYQILFMDGTTVSYITRIHLLEYVLFDLDSLISYYHILGIYRFGNDNIYEWEEEERVWIN